MGGIMIGVVLSQVIIQANAEMHRCQAQLEIEESGREVASLQGRIVGCKTLLQNIQVEFKMPAHAIENTNDKPLELADLNDEDITTMLEDKCMLVDSDEWKRVEARTDSTIESLKNRLLFDAEKSRDLDLSQGQYKAQAFYRNYFRRIEDEAEYRQKRREEAARKKKSQLPFDDEDDNIIQFGNRA